MRLLTGSSADAGALRDALGLSPHTVGFTLRLRAGQEATLDVEMRAPGDRVGDLVAVFKRYRIVEMQNPLAADDTGDGIPFHPV